VVPTRQSTLSLTLHWPLSVEQTQKMKAESRRSHLLPPTVCKTTTENTPILNSLLCGARMNPEPLLGLLFSMSPLPRLHHHDIMTIVEIFFIYAPFVTPGQSAVLSHFVFTNTDKKGKLPFPGPNPNPNCNTKP